MNDRDANILISGIWYGVSFMMLVLCDAYRVCGDNDV